MIQNRGVNKKKKPRANWKGKGRAVVRKKITLPSKKENPTKGFECFHCGIIGHWRLNCPLYLVELKKGKAGQTNKSGVEGK